MAMKKEECRLLHEENLQLHNQHAKKDQEIQMMINRVAELQDTNEQLGLKIRTLSEEKLINVQKLQTVERNMVELQQHEKRDGDYI